MTWTAAWWPATSTARAQQRRQPRSVDRRGWRSSAHEAEDRRGDIVGLVELGQMPRAGDDPRLGPRFDGLGNGGGVAPGHQPVLLAPQNQGRRLDERKAP